MERRTFLGMLALGLATAVAGGAAELPDSRRTLAGGTPGPGPEPGPVPTPTGVPTAPVPYLSPSAGGGPIDPVYARPPYQPPKVVSAPPVVTDQIALTIDDGFDPDVVAAYVTLAADTGIHITFSPNGVYRADWERHAPVLRPLIEAGQVQIGNHTYSHLDLRSLSATKINAEIERNEQWVNKTFGTSTYPYLRPPFGFYDRRVEEACAQAGFHQILMWNGSLGDAAVLTPQVLLQQANLYCKPGTILLGHANHPAVTHCYSQILELIRSRDLSLVTLDEMLGTVRPQPVSSAGTVGPSASDSVGI